MVSFEEYVPEVEISIISDIGKSLRFSKNEQVSCSIT